MAKQAVLKILRNNPNQLVLANTLWVLGILLVLFIMVFVGIGIAMMGAGGESLWFGLLFALGGGGLGFCVSASWCVAFRSSATATRIVF